MVEMLIVFVPLITLFLCMIELSRLAIAQLMVERAAGMAVRACAVIKDQPKSCDETAPAGEASSGSSADELIRLAASKGLRPWADTNVTLGVVECKTQKPSGEDKLQLQAQFRCAVPIARDILCGGGRRPIAAAARYAHQGASYSCEYAHMEAPGGAELELPDLGGAWP